MTGINVRIEETEVDTTDDKTLLLNNEKIKNKKNSSRRNNDLLKNIIILILTCLVIILSLRSENKSLLNDSGKYNLNELDKINELNGKNILNNNTIKIEKPLVEGFVFVDPENPKGPITVNLKRDDGTKIDYNKLIKPENDTFYYKYEEFKKLADKIPKKERYFCELGTTLPPEYYKGYEIACPRHYTITIDKVFYGRHANDTKHCNTFSDGSPVEEEMLIVKKECGNSPMREVKEYCEGKITCHIKPGGSHFTDSCSKIFKYLHIKYHCIKDKVS